MWWRRTELDQTNDLAVASILVRGRSFPTTRSAELDHVASSICHDPLRSSLLLLWLLVGSARGDTLGLVDEVEFQPLSAQVRQIIEAYDVLGQPLAPCSKRGWNACWTLPDNQARTVRAIQEILDPLCLVGITINPESRVQAVPVSAAPQLVQHGWRVFLVKVRNEAGVTAPLMVQSPNAAPVYRRSTGRPRSHAVGLSGRRRAALGGSRHVRGPTDATRR